MIFLLNEVQFDCAKLFPDGEHIGCERGEGQVGLPLIESHGLQDEGDVRGGVVRSLPAHHSKVSTNG